MPYCKFQYGIIWEDGWTNCCRAHSSNHERDWDEHLPTACFRYNTTAHDTSGGAPFNAMHGVETSHFDKEVGVRMRRDEDRAADWKPLGEPLAEIHPSLLNAGFTACRRVKKQYKKLFKEFRDEVGDLVLIYSPLAVLERGRKPRGT